MSLTSHLGDRESPVRGFIHSAFGDIASKLGRSTQPVMKSATTMRPQVSSGYPYPTIGTAMDYRLRYYFASTPYENLVAYDGAAILADAYPRYSNLTKALFDGLSQFELDSPAQRRLAEPEEYQLDRYCYVLALLEQLYRSSRAWESSPLLGHDTTGGWLSIPSEQEIHDLANLSWLFYDSYSNLLTLPYNLNPTFAGSNDVGGADADLIVDGKLIDIKTTIKASVTKDYIYQLIGYVLLDYADEYQIDGIGLYMARQGILLQWDLESVLSDLSSNLRELRSHFQQIAANLPSV